MPLHPSLETTDVRVSHCRLLELPLHDYSIELVQSRSKVLWQQKSQLTSDRPGEEKLHFIVCQRGYVSY